MQEAMCNGVGGRLGDGEATGSQERVHEAAGCDKGGSWCRKPIPSSVKSVGAGGSSVGSVDGATLGRG